MPEGQLIKMTDPNAAPADDTDLLAAAIAFLSYSTLLLYLGYIINVTDNCEMSTSKLSSGTPLGQEIEA